MNGLVLRDDVGPVTILTLNRPEKLNALSPELFHELRGHVDVIAKEGTQIRCIVVRGAGRSFCAGADINALKAGIVMEDREMRSETLERLGRMKQAVIASVHGHCYTGGLELALAADIIIAATDTTFCDTHAKLGIAPRWGMSARLPRRVGPAVAKRLSLTSEPIDAHEALRISLCDYVVSSERRDTFTMGIATNIATNDPSSIATIKHLYENSLAVSLDEALAYERQYTSSTVLR
ncbi:enoyl-CoA hydratase/isomerase family protein [Microvirga puerhi]|uniref:Enoyl-CoA hydratase/isomerase family protein n=1 Tax=Microvirga puerhi TaxID=2876078 RepID=A0ABS7VSF4_9HYPH|nr:enoyl-CoA hydratase/isomerase family protein [Microvirga puerhi]MBZ6078470.1 enoyl-CoA hydratase/isomerase family protein [Microvirga puerhi]